MHKSRISSHVEGLGRIMITDHGTHPPEFWAQVTAEHIAPINQDMTGKRRIAALTLQAAIAEVLEPHHTECVKNCTEVNPEKHLDDVMNEIEAVAKGTEWEQHFTFVRSEPAFLAEYEKQVAIVGEAHLAQGILDGHVTPLTPEQEAVKRQWDRYQLIRFEIGRHLATAQHIHLDHKRTSKGAH